jgi:quinol monooxygenase YgiN
MQVSWWVELAVRPDDLDAFEALTGEMVAAARNEQGVLAYQRFVSHDRLTVYVHERYEHSAAAVAHLVKFAATFGERYGRLVERKRFLVLGDPSDALRAILDKYGATYHRPFGPFPYWG